MQTFVPSRHTAPRTGPGGRPVLHRALALVLAALTAAFVVVATAGPAAAHDQLLSTDPTAGATLEKAPETLELTFSGQIQDIGHEIRVTDSQGRDVTQGTVAVKGKTVSQPLRDNGGGDETYTVVWRVVSQDGHPIEGRFQYDVGSGAPAGVEATTGASAVPQEPGIDDRQAVESGSAGMPGWALPAIGGAIVGDPGAP